MVKNIVNVKGVVTVDGKVLPDSDVHFDDIETFGELKVTGNAVFLGNVKLGSESAKGVPVTMEDLDAFKAKIESDVMDYIKGCKFVNPKIGESSFASEASPLIINKIKPVVTKVKIS